MNTRFLSELLRTLIVFFCYVVLMMYHLDHNVDTIVYHELEKDEKEPYWLWRAIEINKIERKI
jgi:hypothetical protein